MCDCNWAACITQQVGTRQVVGRRHRLARDPRVEQRLLRREACLGVDVQKVLQQVLGGQRQVGRPLGEAQSELLLGVGLRVDLAAVVVEWETATQ